MSDFFVDAPDYSPLGQLLQERTEPIQTVEVDAENDYAHGHLCEAMMQPFFQLSELVDPPDPYGPWDPLFYLDITPDWALQWLGQVVGVRVPDSATPDEARAMIREMSYEQIGKPDTIRTAASSTLIPPDGVAPTIFFREREDGDAYVVEVTTLVSETPDPAATQAAIQAALPAGLKLVYGTVVGWDYEAMETEGGTYLAQKPKFTNYGNMARNVRV
jgi:hypothetical protein